MSGAACRGHQLVVVAGGQGTRLAELTGTIPKPMAEIGGKPILWHIMKIYAAHGVDEFIICTGYKGYLIKEYFANLFLHSCDVTIDTGSGGIEYHASERDSWRVTVLDTGADTQTGGRLRRAADHIKGDRPFLFTYGDCLGDVDLGAELEFHKRHGKLATVTSVAPPGRFGRLSLDGDRVDGFTEKPAGDGDRINGGFFVLDPKVLGYIDGDETPLEAEPLTRLAGEGELMAWRHDGYWQVMDTLREKNVLEQAWADGAPWRVWDRAE